MTISTSHSHSLRGLLAVAFFGVTGLACAVQPPAAGASAASAARLRGPVTELIGEAPCDTQDQCHVIGVGAKPCGGPGGYLAWSDKKTNRAALEAAAQAETQAQIAENKASGLISDCMMAPVPTAVCRPRASDGRKSCALGQGGADSAI